MKEGVFTREDLFVLKRDEIISMAAGPQLDALVHVAIYDCPAYIVPEHPTRAGSIRAFAKCDDMDHTKKEPNHAIDDWHLPLYSTSDHAAQDLMKLYSYVLTQRISSNWFVALSETRPIKDPDWTLGTTLAEAVCRHVLLEAKR